MLDTTDLVGIVLAVMAGAMLGSWLLARIRMLRICLGIWLARTEGQRAKAKAQRTSSEASSARSRRALLTGTGIGAVAGVLLPKRVKADLSMSEVEQAFTSALENIFGGLIELIFSVLRLIAMPSGARIIAFVNEILGLLDGEDTYMRSGQARDSMEKSWPSEPIMSPDGQREQLMIRTAATRSRVEQSCTVCARVAEENGMFTTEEQLLVAVVENSGQYGLVVVLQAILHMIGLTNARLGNITAQNTAIAQLLSDQTLRAAGDEEQAMMAHGEYMAGAGETIRPVVERPAR